MTEEVTPQEDILTPQEEADLRSSLDSMVEAVKTYCEQKGKITASEKRIISAMKDTTNILAEEIVKLYKSNTQVDDMTLLEIVDKNREKILNDLLYAAMTPKKRLLSEEAKEVLAMVSKELLGA
ncbi:MAG: hypothetical protein KGD64_15355 [Candidatus Heimdallarchaeota archaeon]|nr:hypothetical protein [Candidatus Heimdallarchaeota archaeon]